MDESLQRGTEPMEKDSVAFTVHEELHPSLYLAATEGWGCSPLVKFCFVISMHEVLGSR